MTDEEFDAALEEARFDAELKEARRKSSRKPATTPKPSLPEVQKRKLIAEGKVPISPAGITTISPAMRESNIRRTEVALGTAGKSSATIRNKQGAGARAMQAVSNYISPALNMLPQLPGTEVTPGEAATNLVGAGVGVATMPFTLPMAAASTVAASFNPEAGGVGSEERDQAIQENMEAMGAPFGLPGQAIRTGIEKVAPGAKGFFERPGIGQISKIATDIVPLVALGVAGHVATGKVFDPINTALNIRALEDIVGKDPENLVAQAKLSDAQARLKQAGFDSPDTILGAREGVTPQAPEMAPAAPTAAVEAVAPTKTPKITIPSATTKKPEPTIGDRVQMVVEGRMATGKLQEGQIITGKVVHPASVANPYVLLDKPIDGGKRWSLEGNPWIPREASTTPTIPIVVSAKEPVVPTVAGTPAETPPAPSARGGKKVSGSGGTLGRYVNQEETWQGVRPYANVAIPHEPVKASKIVGDLQNVLAPVRTGRFRQRAIGIFKTRENIIRTRLANDLPTVAHEVGHALHKVLFPELTPKRGRLAAMAIPREHWAELKPLAYAGARGEVVEGYAEFIRHYLTNPVEAQRIAPKFYGFFSRKLAEFPEIRTVLEKAQKDIGLWANQPADARVQSTISTGEPSPKTPYDLSRFYKDWVDSLEPLRVAEKAIAEGKPVATSKSPFKTAWLQRGVASKSQTWLEDAVTSESGKRIDKSLREVLASVGDLDSFRRYLIAKQAIDVIAVKGSRSMPLPIEDYQAVIANAPKEYEAIQQEVIKYQDHLLGELVKSGLVSKDSAVEMRTKWPNHVPLYRVFEEQPRGGLGRGFANLPTAIKRLKGSGRDIVDPIESIVKNTFMFHSLAGRNKVMLRLADLANSAQNKGMWIEKVPPAMRPTQVSLGEVLGIAETDPVWADIFDAVGSNPESISTIFRPSGMAPAGENIVRTFRNGKAEYYQLDPDLYTAITASDAQSSNILVKILSTPAALLRAGATLTPEFAVRNPMRDVGTAMVNSAFGFMPWDFVRGLYHTVKGRIGGDELYTQFQSTGAAHSMMVSLDRDYLQRAMRSIYERKPSEHVVDYAKHPLDALRALSEFAEEATRIGEFGKGTHWGKATDINKILEAAISSRDITVDFSRSGDLGKQANRITAFFNAGVGGMDKMVRTFRDYPIRSTTRALAYITVPSVALYLVNRKDERYQQLPEWEKDMFWIIPTKNHLIRVPKPFELGIIFGAFPERILRKLDQDDPHAFDAIANDALSVATPNIIPTAIVPWMQVLTNRSFTGAPIVPEREKRLPAPLQIGPQTSGTAQLLGRLLDQSPRKIDTLVQGYLGGLGKYATQGTDVGLRTVGLYNPPPRPKAKISEYPVMRAVMSAEYRSGVDVERMYQELQRLQDRKGRAEGRIGPELTETQQARLGELNQQAKSLSNLRKVERAVMTARTKDELYQSSAGFVVSGKTIEEQKRRIIDEIRKTELDIVHGQRLLGTSRGGLKHEKAITLSVASPRSGSQYIKLK